jgi:mediator of RNA polymerase II transcription subunit 17
LAKIAQKIDFSKTNGEEIKKEQLEGGEKGEEDSKDSTSFQSSLWPWDSVRNKLRFVMLFCD